MNLDRPIEGRYGFGAPGDSLGEEEMSLCIAPDWNLREEVENYLKKIAN